MTNTEILKFFGMKIDTYHKLETVVNKVLIDEVKNKNFFVMSIQHRTKTANSLGKKIEKKKGKYSELKDITDLCGFRIICYFSDAVDVIADAIRNKFCVDEKNSVDKRASLNSNEFGYLSVHIVASLPDNGEYDSDICGIPFEIQIRTVLQHVWAEIEHDLGYKNEFPIPKPIVREFSKIAGLLEIADDQFIRIRNKTSNYVQAVHNKITTNEGEDIPLDYISLNAYLTKSNEICSFKKRLLAELNLEITDVEISIEHLAQLKWFNVESVESLYELFENNKDYIFEEMKKAVDMFDFDIMSSLAIINFMCEGELIRSDCSEKQMRQYFSVTGYDENHIEKRIKVLLAEKQSS